MEELQFLHTALLLIVIYLWVKFEVTSFYTLEVMSRTKIHSKNLKTAVTRQLNEIELWFLYTALHLNVIYLYANLKLLAFILWKSCPGQKSKVEIYNGQ